MKTMTIMVVIMVVLVMCGSVDAGSSVMMDSCAAVGSTPREEKYKAMWSSAKEIEGDVIALRRELHRRPAIMYEEYEAQELVMSTLSDLGIKSKTMAITGVTADLGADVSSASTPPKVVVLRADMDALPIKEEADVEFKSEIDGVMHACGHDTHTAMLLGAAKLLKPYESRLAAEGKTVRFAFQPSEEGGAGGKMMLDEGLLDGASAAFALHTNSKTDVGVIVGKEGYSSASTQSWTIIIRGKGGHAARPHDTIDPVNAAAQVVLSLNTIVSRMVDNPNSPVIIGVTAINGGDAMNVIPEQVKLLGTIRTTDDESMHRMQGILKNRAIDIAAANGCSATVTFRGDVEFTNSRGAKYRTAGYPAKYNDPALVKMGLHTAVELFKDDDGSSDVAKIVKEDTSTALGGEDFAFFAKKVPSAMFGIGHAGSNPKTSTAHHNPNFLVDEAMLVKGAAFYAQIALDYLDSSA